MSEREEIETSFLVSRKKMPLTKSGKPYIDLILQDKTGTISAKIWDSADYIDKLVNCNDYVLVSGTIENYNTSLQVRVGEIEKISPSEITEDDYIPSSAKSVEEMKGKLREILLTVKNPFLLRLIGLFWNDDEFMGLFCKWPAAMKMHHAYKGGLLEHTLSVVENCNFFISKYSDEDVKGDILLTAAFFHDIGKVYELDFASSIKYTESGQLLGHIVLGIRMVQKKIDMIENFPENLTTQFEHILISHHGELDFGSPKVPMNLEAFILHYSDNIDAKIKMVHTLCDEANKKGEAFLYAKSLERYISTNRDF